MLALTVGYPGAGKTAWAARFKGLIGFVVVDKADFRASLFGRETPGDEDHEAFVESMVATAVSVGLAQGLIVIVPDTNLSARRRTSLAGLAEKHGRATVLVDFMDVPVTECIARDAKRPAPRGGDVIVKFAMEWPKPNVERFMRAQDLPILSPTDAERLMREYRARR